ncbi:hypothetical protein EYC84_001858 [Monilinia fructicola]|uniref:Uncharacterized protein n=1 Tax=Monilinia fructicola TaxID=38448 RepID=A0A5M9JUX0_MONFR|nr:hypothetical protein EYC84_001858 [Monilinia fructicola]
MFSLITTSLQTQTTRTSTLVADVSKTYYRVIYYRESFSGSVPCVLCQKRRHGLSSEAPPQSFCLASYLAPQRYPPTVAN